MGSFLGGLTGGTLGAVIVDVALDTTKLEAGLVKTRAELEALGNSGNQIAARTAPAMGRLGALLANPWTKAAAVAVAATAIIGGAAVKAFMQAEEVMAQTVSTISDMEGVAGVTATEVQALAGSLAQMSGVNDEAIQSSINLLLTFDSLRNQVGTTNDVLTEASKLALGLSIRFNKDLSQSAVMVGKALNDPVAGLTALQRVGVQFTEQQKSQINALVESGDLLSAQKVIMAELTRQVGTAAQAYGGTFSGAMGKLAISVGDLGEKLGGYLVPALTATADALNFLVSNIDVAVGAFGRLYGPLGDLIPGVGLLQDVIGQLNTAFGHSDPMADFQAGFAALEQQVENTADVNLDELTADVQRLADTTGVELPNGARAMAEALLAAKPPTSELAASTEELAAAHKAAAAAAKEQKAAEQALAGGLLGLVASAKEVNAAQREVNALRRKGKTDTKAYDNAVLAALNAQDSFNGSIREYMQTQKAAGATQAQAIAKVVQLGKSIGLTKSDVLGILGPLDQYKGKLDAVPGKVNTNVTANTSQALSMVQTFISAVNAIPDVVTTIVQTITTGSSSGGDAVGGVRGMARGGFVTNGPTFANAYGGSGRRLSGEGAYNTFAGKGAEAVIPLNGRGIDILAEAVKRGNERSGAVSGGGAGVTVNVYPNGLMNEERLMEAASRHFARVIRNEGS